MQQNNVFLFPGQGSQSVGILKDILEHFPEAIDYFNQASNVLSYDLWELIQNGPAAVLNQTEKTQPALLVTSYALFELLKQHLSLPVAAMAGHSLGEYSALVCARALSFEDGIRLVQLRGQLMQQAVPEGVGGMAAIIGLSSDVVGLLCEKASQDDDAVNPANFNSSSQTVVSGKLSAVQRVIELAKQEKAKIAKLLPMSVPSHSSLMHDAATAFKPKLEACAMQLPNVPVISNVTAQPYQSTSEIKELLVQQLYSPVMWSSSMESLVETYQTFVECGPGKVLLGLMKRGYQNVELKHAEQLLLNIKETKS